MLFTTDFAWKQIADWTKLGLTHHEEIASLIEADRVLDSYIGKRGEQLPAMTDPKTVIAAVEARAERLAITDGPNSPLSKAISSARSTIAHQGVAAARANLDHYLDQLGGRFDQAAKAYVKSSAKLPEVFAGDDIAGFDTEMFDAYQQTKQAAAEIRAVRDFLVSLRSLSPANGKDTYQVHFLVLDPGSPETFAEVQYAAPESTDRIYEAVDPVMLKAVRAGARLRIATPAERDAQCAEYEAELAAAQEKQESERRVSVIR